jgi:hypothetical protein
VGGQDLAIDVFVFLRKVQERQAAAFEGLLALLDKRIRS